MNRLKMGSDIVRGVALFCLVVLLTIMISQPIFGQDASVFQRYPGATLSGLITAQVTTPEDRCRKICTERSGCAGFDFSSSTGQCRIFGGIAGARDDSSSTAATRYPVAGYRLPSSDFEESEPDEVPSDEVARNFLTYLNYDVFGFDLGDSPATSMAQCESLCRQSRECRAYTFNEWNQKCFLKSGSSDLRLEPRARTGVLTSDRQPSFRDAQVVMEYYRGYTITGSQIGGARSTTSRDSCESMCWNSEQCIAFSFLRGQKQCRMYDQATNRFAKSGVDSGAKIQPRP